VVSTWKLRPSNTSVFLDMIQGLDELMYLEEGKKNDKELLTLEGPCDSVVACNSEGTYG
jgi:hypothetical protein